MNIVKRKKVRAKVAKKAAKKVAKKAAALAANKPKKTKNKGKSAKKNKTAKKVVPAKVKVNQVTDPHGFGKQIEDVKSMKFKKDLLPIAKLLDIPQPGKQEKENLRALIILTIKAKMKGDDA